MDKNIRTFVLIGVGGVGVYLLYRYLESEGYLAKWFPEMFGPDTTPAKSDTTKSSASGATNTSGGGGSGTPDAGAKKMPAAPQVLCWDGKYVTPPATCAPMPAFQKAKTSGELATESLNAARADLYQKLVAQGVEGSIASTYIDHCGTSGVCDDTFLNDMYGLAAMGIPAWMKLTDVGGILFTADEWEYYRERKGGVALDPGSIFEDRNIRIHASDFVRALHTFASGGGMSGMPAHMAWTM